jgi:hypothetical protein
VEQLQSLLDLGEDTYETLAPQLNFELLKPVPAEQLRFFEVRKLRHENGEGGWEWVTELTPFRP